MNTLKNRLLVEFDASIVENHILPVIAEWLEDERKELQSKRNTLPRNIKIQTVSKLLSETEQKSL